MQGSAGPLVRQAGEGERNAAFALPRTFKITAAETGGAYSAWEDEAPPGAGPPMHVHRRQHELFHVLQGRVLFRCDGTDAVVAAGATVAVPPGVPHTFKNIGQDTARFFVVLTPGGLETFFRAVEAERLEPPADMKRIAELADAADLEFVGPPIA